MEFFNTGVVESMFHLRLPLIEKITRSIAVYFVLIVLLRIFGSASWLN
jgi:hypothetical protein